MSFRRLPLTLVWPAAGFTFVCGIYFFWAWSKVLDGFGGDNAFYLLIAKYFSPWSGHSDIAAHFFSHSFYPPLYPLVLAFFGGGESLLVAHVVTVTCLLLAFLAIYAWMRALNMPMLVAGLLVLLFALMPGTYMQALAILSENLYLFLTLVCIASVAAYENDNRIHWLWLATFSLAAASITRSAGISLVVACAMYLALHRPPRFWLLAAAAIVPLAAWNLFSHHESSGYLSVLAEKYRVEPLASFIRNLSIEIRVLWIGWISNFTGSYVLAPLLGFLAAICVGGALYRAYRRRLDGFYSITYLVLILVWPFPAEAQRLLFVIVPVLLVQGVLLLELLPRLWIGDREIKPVYVLFVAVFLVIVPDLALTTSRFLKPLPAELSDYRRMPGWYAVDPDEARMNVMSSRSLVENLESIRAVVPEKQCIYAIKPSIVSYLSQRISYAPPKPQLDVAAFDAYIGQTKCRYVYMMAFSSPTFPEPYYPLSRVRNSLRIVGSAPVNDILNGPAGLLAEWVHP